MGLQAPGVPRRPRDGGWRVAAGLLDEILVSQVPVLLAGGERPFDGLPAGTKVELASVVEGREALHLTYRFDRAESGI